MFPHVDEFGDLLTTILIKKRIGLNTYMSTFGFYDKIYKENSVFFWLYEE